LRSRGTSIAEYSGPPYDVGSGNDYHGWEFYKNTKVAFGTVIYNGTRYQYPAPTSMKFRPDKMKVNYTVADVEIYEEKFVAENDVISTIITSSKPIKIEFDGQSMVPEVVHDLIISKNASCSFD